MFLLYSVLNMQVGTFMLLSMILNGQVKQREKVVVI